MRKIKIVVDSTSDLTSEQVAQMGITVVPLNITINGNTYIDGVDFTPEEFIEKMKLSPELPKSSQPATGLFVEVFDRIHAEDTDTEILCIMLSEQLSGTCQSARLASDMTDAKVTVVDSGHVSFAAQIQILEAYKLVQVGCQIEEIVERLAAIRERTRLIVAVDNLENFVKGGRLSKGKAMISNLLNIKPILEIKGTVDLIDKVRSTGKVMKYFMAKLQEDLHTGGENKELKYIGVIYVGEKENAITLEEEIKKLHADIEIAEIPATSVLATHAGSGTFAICYLVE